MVIADLHLVLGAKQVAVFARHTLVVVDDDVAMLRAADQDPLDGDPLGSEFIEHVERAVGQPLQSDDALEVSSPTVRHSDGSLTCLNRSAAFALRYRSPSQMDF